MEECVLWCVCKGNTNGCNYARHTKHLTSCGAPDCNIIALTIYPPQSMLKHVPAFMNMSCLETAHSSRCDGLFFEATQGDQTYYKTKITHPVAVQLGNFARNQLPRLSAR
eukprot:9401881-Ditylum_brightwellii.AAC.1